MSSKDVKIFRKADIFVFIAVILLALMLFLCGIQSASDAQILVNVDGKESVLFLDKDTELELKNNSIRLTLTVKNGQVSVTQSSCPDKTCLNTGKIDKIGQIIICAPAKISIKIIGSGGGFDAVSG